MYIERDLKVKILQLSKQFPVLSITGPRQSGKTTLIKNCFPSYQYMNLEIPDVRSFAQEDPRGFLKDSARGIIIDEAQYVPHLFSYIQAIADESGDYGKIILSGSQNFLLAKTITQSLAGRVAILNLFPFSQSELGSAGLDVDNYIKLIFNGFYPAIYDRNINPADFYPNYIQSYLERDVRNITNVFNLTVFKSFLEILAGRTSQIINYSSISNDLGIDQKTVKNWMAILEASFVIFLLRPYHKNFNKRIIKAPKLYFYDTGLVCSLLRIKNEADIQYHFLKGSLFENLIIAELLKRYYHVGIRPDFYFWRDSTGNEVDLIIDDGAKVKFLEIKAAQTPSGDLFKGLNTLRKIMPEDENQYYLIYGGNEKQVRNNINLLCWNHLSELLFPSQRTL